METADRAATPATHPDPAERPPLDEPIATRRALRAARRRRRQLAIALAFALAVCFALTILVVDLARDRAPGAIGGGLLSASANAHAHPMTLHVPNTLDASMSEGGIL